MQHTDLIALRRDLHRNAEPGFCEIRTASVIERTLESLPLTLLKGELVQNLADVVNYPSGDEREEWYRRAIATGIEPERARYFRDHGTAMVAVLEGNRPGPVWGLRTDIDALRLQEPDESKHYPAREGFNSETGAMHACGHDCHAAIGIGVLEALADHNFAGTLKVIFQPAEEGVRGADTIVHTGVADDITKMIGLHVDGPSPVGEVTASTEGGMAVRGFMADFTGVASHASMAPQEGRNALLAASSAALSIMSLPRFSSADTRLNVGKLTAGDAVNIVPSLARMEAEARAADNSVLDDLVGRVEQVLDGTASAYGVSVEHKRMGYAVTINPDEELIDAIATAAQGVDGITQVNRRGPMGASDDASLFIRNTQERGGQGAFTMVGCASPAPHHNNYFDADERVIAIGESILENLVRA